MSRTPNYGTAGTTENSSALPTVGFADFSPTEMFNLCENIGSNITAINSGWKSLDKKIKSIGTAKDNKTLRDNIHQTRQSIDTAVQATNKDLHRLNVVVRRGDKRQKLQVETLAQNFTDALTKYTAVEKQLNEKIRKNILKTPMTEFINQDNEDISDDTARLMAQKQAQAQMLEFETALLEEREAYMRTIEVSVIDANQIIRGLSTHIREQGTVIDSIESNIETGAANVESGIEELAKANQYAAKFRRKIFIMIAIAVIVGIILTIIIVNSLKR